MVNIQTLVFMDLEATGLMTPLHKPKITELTLIAVHCSEFLQAHLGSTMPRILNKLTVCVNPRKAITAKACEMTGLYNDSLEHQHEFDKDTVALIDVFLRRLAPPVCLLAHYGNRFDFPLLKAEIDHARSELTADIVCADTWEMFQSLDKRTYIPVTWTRKDHRPHEQIVPNGLFSHGHTDSTLPALDKNHSQKPPSSNKSDNDTKRNSCDVPNSHYNQDCVEKSDTNSTRKSSHDLDTPNSSRSSSPPEHATVRSPMDLVPKQTKSDNSKTGDTKHVKEATRKITSFSIKDIVTTDKDDADSSHLPAIVSSGLTIQCGSVSPANVISKTDLPVGSGKTDDCQNDVKSVASSATGTNENDSNRVVDGKDSSGVSVVPVPADETETDSSKYDKRSDLIRIPAKKRFCHLIESQKHDNHKPNQTLINPKVSSPADSDNDVAQVPSSQMSEAVSAPVLNSSPGTSSYTNLRCKTPEVQLISEETRKCPRSPTKRKPSDTGNGSKSQAKKIKKKLFDNEESSSPKSDSAAVGAEPVVSSSQGSNSEASNSKQRLESLGTIIYWHDYFNEEFFKESLEMDDCLHPKPDSSSSREHTLEKKLSPVGVPQNHISAADTTNPDPVATGNDRNFSNRSNPVLRSALTAPLNLSLRDHDEPDVTSSLLAPISTESYTSDSCSNSCRPSVSGHVASPSSATSNKPPVGAASNSKVSYSQREIFRRAFGIYPPLSHRSEDDCLTLMQTVQQVAPKAAIWIEVNSCPFQHVEPLYTLQRS